MKIQIYLNLNHVNPLSIQQELRLQGGVIIIINQQEAEEEETQEKPENSADANLGEINIESSSHIFYKII